MGYGCIITLKATRAPISDGLPYLPYIALRVNGNSYSKYTLQGPKLKVGLHVYLLGGGDEVFAA